MSAPKPTPCPRCATAEDVAHPRNYGREQKDRWWCMKCGALWTPLTVLIRLSAVAAVGLDDGAHPSAPFVALCQIEGARIRGRRYQRITAAPSAILDLLYFVEACPAFEPPGDARLNRETYEDVRAASKGWREALSRDGDCLEPPGAIRRPIPPRRTT